MVSASVQPAARTWDAPTLFNEALTRMRAEGHSYPAHQLSQLVPLEFTEGSLRLGVNDKFFRDFVDDHLRELLVKTLTDLVGFPVRLSYDIIAKPNAAVEEPSEAKVVSVRQPARLNERFTFGTYVVADSNQLSAAAAQAVADNPGRTYNPLFIYGGTGLGKTHLLHAVGNRIVERNPAARVVYLSSEEFTNQFIESVREQRMTEFRRRFRESCDVLLIDDIQFLGKKQETQNEFFYTFNALHQLSRAIVLTSDTVPAEIPGLEERLRSRFTMGLITDIQEPNFEMRIAILKTKAANDGFDLPDSVAQFIARHIQRNVRELEGALVKLSAVHSLTKQPLTEAFAAQVLRDVLPSAREVDAEHIVREVARYYKLTVEDLKGKRRTQEVAYARQMAMYFCRQLTRTSLPEIGRRFAKDHTTVLASVRKIEGLRQTDATLQRELADLEARLTNS